MPRRPYPHIVPSSLSRGRWTVPGTDAAVRRPARAVGARSSRRTVALVGVMSLLLVLGLAKLAADATGVVAQEGAPVDDACAAAGLQPIGDTGLCTHGPDPLPPGVSGADVPDPIAGAGAAPPIDCVGDGRSGNRVQVLYVRGSDEPSRLSAYRGLFNQTTKLANQSLRDSAAETGGTRSIRFVHSASCELSIVEVVVGPAEDNNFSVMVDALVARGFGSPFDVSNRKYLIYLDEPASGLCGQATQIPGDRRDAVNPNNTNTGYAAVFSNCWDQRRTAAHETLHMLGAVQNSAPNSTGAGHCVDEFEVLCYDDGGPTSNVRVDCPDLAQDQTRIDCNHDDYFHTNPPAGSYLAEHWNTASNRFLIGAVDAPSYPVPPNDLIERATRASARPFRESIRVYTATDTFPGDPDASCTPYGLSNTVWYRTTAGSAGSMVVDTAGSSYRSVVAVYRGSPGSLTEVACDVAPGSPSEEDARVQLTATAGTTYYVMVGAYFSEGGALLNIQLTGPPEPPSLALDKVSSKFNGSVVATLTNFAPNSSVTLRWPQLYPVNATDPPSTNLLASGTTDASGTARLRFRTPLQPFVATGYVVTARDAAGRTATDTLRVIPRIMLNEDAGTKSTRLRVYFYGFAPNERIDVRWHVGATNTTSYTVLKTLTVASNGRASAIVTIPSNAAVGRHLIVGKVVGVSRSASTPFNLLAGGGSVDDPTATPTRTPTLEATESPTPEATATPEPAPTDTPTPEPTATATPEPAPTETPTPVPTPTATPVPNASPAADGGEDRTATDEDGSGGEDVPLDGSASADPEGGPLSFAWSVDGVVVSTEAAPILTLPVGVTTVTLTVTDDQGATSTDEVVVVIAPAGEEA